MILILTDIEIAIILSLTIPILQENILYTVLSYLVVFGTIFLMDFLFRGIEKNANWVNKVFFVTYGHLPKWLNVKNEKLVIVNHKDFIPEKYLPTFNSNVIELNIHRIKGLSEKFILFNDDFFLLKQTKPSDFFIKGKPTDVYVESIMCPPSHNDAHFMMKSNIIYLINKYFNKAKCIKENKNKFVNIKYGDFNKSTLYCMKYKDKFLGFKSFHAPYPYLKETFKTIWEKEPKLLDEVCHNKFRTSSDLGHFLCRYWQMVSGNFEPRKNESKYIYYKNDNKENIKELTSGKYKFICINDVLTDLDFEKSRDEINAVLQELFPKKSSFEL